MKRIFPITLMVVLLLNSCKDAGDGLYMRIHGFTQGTTYIITYQTPDSVNLGPAIDSLLRDFDLSLSAYIPNSLISKINNNEPGIVIDDKFTAVWDESVRINKLTNGAFDITVGPLINAWGFGPGGKLDIDSMIVDSLMQYVGMEKVKLVNGALIKESPAVLLDVNGIAQGYAVDVVADYLLDLGLKNFLINIGGEIRCAGLNPGNSEWKVGVDKPIFGSPIPGQELQAVLKLKDISLASSGNYRKYYEVDGKKIVHTLDPATGYTRMSQLLSATIITKECMTADALATACMVMGPEKAKEFISGIKGVEAYFILSDDDGLYSEWYTPGVEEMIKK